jgi:hypothetical protein
MFGKLHHAVVIKEGLFEIIGVLLLNNLNLSASLDFTVAMQLLKVMMSPRHTTVAFHVTSLT